MSTTTTTDRVHFYERQYLRAFDLIAEQTYHLEMRRRLNLALHLWGIVDGLDVAKGAPVVGAPEQVIVSPGMAIDGFGREIVLPVAYALSHEDLRRNRVQTAGDYWLSIAYRRELTTPPAPGYRLCDLENQFTRWHESYAFLITDADPTPATPTPVTAPLPDDPLEHDWPVVIGKVRVVLTGGNLAIDDGWLSGRVYVGSRTERLVSPVASLPSGAAESLRPIRIQADALAEKNLAVGENFPINPADVLTPPNLPPQFPPTTGSLKVKTDLFVEREIYKYNGVTKKWSTLTNNIRQFVPDVQLRELTIAVTPPGTDTTHVDIQTVLENTSARQFTAALASVTGKTKGVLRTNWYPNVADAELWQIDVHFQGPATLVGTRTWRFPLKWTVGPVSTDALHKLPITEIKVSCVAVFVP